MEIDDARQNCGSQQIQLLFGFFGNFLVSCFAFLFCKQTFRFSLFTFILHCIALLLFLILLLLLFTLFQSIFFAPLCHLAFRSFTLIASHLHARTFWRRPENTFPLTLHTHTHTRNTVVMTNKHGWILQQDQLRAFSLASLSLSRTFIC